jgi:hypothetical protein
MKNFIIGILVVVVIVLGYLQFKEKNLIKESLSPVANQQTEVKSYIGSKFSFNYPGKYILTEIEKGVTITSISVPEVDKVKCQQLEDEQARAICFNPINQLSPNITINFLQGNSVDLWKNMTNNINEETIAIGNHTYKYSYTGGEFGGRGIYGLFLNDGLLLATYTHEDMEGGVQFDYLKSSKYLLDRHEQKKLLEQLLATVTIK